MLIKKKSESAAKFTSAEFEKFKAMYKAMEEEKDDDEEDDEEEEDDMEQMPAVIVMGAKKKGKMLKKS